MSKLSLLQYPFLYPDLFHDIRFILAFFYFTAFLIPTNSFPVSIWWRRFSFLEYFSIIFWHTYTPTSYIGVVVVILDLFEVTLISPYFRGNGVIGLHHVLNCLPTSSWSNEALSFFAFAV